MNASLMTLLNLRLRVIRNMIASLRSHSRLKIFVISVFAVSLWVGLYVFFMDGFRFFEIQNGPDIKSAMISYLFAVFFLSLLAMLVFSNGIIAFGSLFRSQETEFLFGMPFSGAQVFSYKLSESLLFSSWAFLFLALPLIVSYGVAEHAPWYYYPGAAAFFAIFALIPAAIGGIATLLIARFFANSPRRVLGALTAGTCVLAIVWVITLSESYHHGIRQPSTIWMQNILGKLSFTQCALLPSYWISNGVQHLAHRDIGDAFYRFGLLLSTALFVGMVGVHASRRIYANAYHRLQSVATSNGGVVSHWFYRLIEKFLPMVEPRLRALIVKDTKTFFRDPVQWSQVLVFFGLLGVYFANMRKFQVEVDSPFWNNLISLLNLTATSLTLSTFTSRFVFPLISLEGRKLWILGLLPIKRRNLLYSKFWFAFLGSFIISESLIWVSDKVLEVGPETVMLHAVTIMVMCAGLCGLAVGIGALYPNLRESNPSKIVSGFGGSLNLLLSVFYVGLVVVCMAVPYHVSQMYLGKVMLAKFMGWGAFFAVALGIVSVILPMWLGSRAFESLEA